MEDFIVGITEYCVEPPLLVRTKPTIGGMKNPDVEAILRLAPDLVVANIEENRREDVERIQIPLAADLGQQAEGSASQGTDRDRC